MTIDTLKISDLLEEHMLVITALSRSISEIERAAEHMTEAIQEGGKILWMGNGGSAADSQHLAAELVGRFVRERRAWPSIALTTDTSILTAVGNDYSFDSIFARQIEALCCPKDVVVGISTSGSSRNVVCGAKRAKEIGAFVIALTGADGGMLKTVADCSITVPSQIVARIQEAHILIGHILCQWIEDSLAEHGGCV